MESLYNKPRMKTNVIKISTFCLLTFHIVGCICKQIETRASVNSISAFTEIFSDSVIYIVFNEKLSSKEKFKLKHHRDVSDSTTHINY